MQGGSESPTPDVSHGQAKDKAHLAGGAVTQHSVTKQAGSVQSPDQQTEMGQQMQQPRYGVDKGVAADSDDSNAISANAHEEETLAAGMDSMTHADDSDTDRVMLDLDDEMEGLISSAADPVDRVMLDLDDEMEGLISAAAAETDVSVVAVLARLSEPKVEAAARWTHAEVLRAEQAVGAAQLAAGGQHASALNQPEGIVIQLEQHEPTAAEDASQHLQLKHIQDVNAAAALNDEALQGLDAVSEVGQPMQPENKVDAE